jgi:hypothetical protein
MSKKLEFTIEAGLPGNYVFMNAYWGEKKRVKENWKTLVFVALRQAKFHYVGSTSYFKGKVKLDVILYRKDKRGNRDSVNVKNMVDKLVVDCLYPHKYTRKKLKYTIPPVAHLLVDDSPEYFTWGEIEQKIGKPERITLIFEEVEP